MTKQERVWRWLRKNGPTKRPAIASALRMTANQVNCTLFRLQGTGHVDRTLDERRHATWFALGSDPPICMLGTHPNTLKNLNQRRDVAIERLKKAFAVRGFDPSALEAKRPPPASDGCLLAQCWGNSKSCKQEDEDALCS